MASLVSILIPCYNAEAFLPEALESALAQTYEKVEVVVVDDGSSDGSLAVARSFEGRGVKVLSQVNAGASAARNAAFRASSGEFIQFLDADDRLDQGKIAAQMERLSRPQSSGFVATCRWGRFVREIAGADFRLDGIDRDLDPVDFLVYIWTHNGMMHPSAWLTPRALIERAGLWDERLSLNDDGEFFARIALASKGLLFCPDAIAYYRSGVEGSLSGLKSRRGYESLLRSLELEAMHLLAAENSPRTRRVAATLFQRFIYELYPQHRDLRARAAEYVREYGGTDLVPEGPPAFQRLRRLFGWKAARLAQHWIYSSGYYRWRARRFYSEPKWGKVDSA